MRTATTNCERRPSCRRDAWCYVPQKGVCACRCSLGVRAHTISLSCIYCRRCCDCVCIGRTYSAKSMCVVYGNEILAFDSQQQHFYFYFIQAYSVVDKGSLLMQNTKINANEAKHSELYFVFVFFASLLNVSRWCQNFRIDFTIFRMCSVCWESV